MKEKVVLITGVTGQDGSYMAEYCLNLGLKVYGLVRRTSQINDKNYKHLLSNPQFKTLYGDLTDGTSIDNVVRATNPDYFINFAAQSFVGASWQIPEETFMAGAVGVLKCLEAVRKYAPECRFYNAGSSEQFGDVIYSPQDEKHPFRPRSPYGAAKCSAHHLVKVYRESYGLYAVQGLLFNHESERRGIEFVTRKITKGIARIVKAIKYGEEFVPIELGNIDAKRDWSHAEDFIDGVWRMLNQEKYNEEIEKKFSVWSGSTTATHKLQSVWEVDIRGYDTKVKEKFLSHFVKEYILSSNETHTIREFIELAFEAAKIYGSWVGDGLNESFIITGDVLGEHKIPTQMRLVTINPEFYRPNEVELLLGDSSAARKDLGWQPKISFDKLVKRMVEYDLYEEGVRPRPTEAPK